MAAAQDFRSGGSGAKVAGLFFALGLWTAVSAFIIRRTPHAVGMALSHVNAMICGVVLMVSASWSGGSTSTFFGYAYALPVVFGVLVPTKPWMGATCALGAAAAALPMLAALHDPVFGVTAELLIVSSGAFAVFGTSVYGRLARAEQASARSREQALHLLAESEKVRASQERFASVGRLASGVAHEINNPLAYVKSNLAYITEELGLDAPDLVELRSVLEETRNGVGRIAHIVADLKAFSRDRVEPPEVLDVPALVDEAVRITSVRLKDRVQVEVEGQAPLMEVVGLPGRVLQVLVNLLVNAGDALDRPKGEGRVRVVCESSSEHYLVHVDDNGPGVPAALVEKIFEPFFTTKPVGNGTGLGLAVSRSYLEQFQGSLQLGTSPLGGARFTVALPRRAGGPASRSAIPEPSADRVSSTPPLPPRSGASEKGTAQGQTA